MGKENCTFCDLVCASVQLLKEHMWRDHRAKSGWTEAPFPCDVCGERHDTADKRKRHRAAAHPDAPKAQKGRPQVAIVDPFTGIELPCDGFVCPCCQTPWSSRIALRDHLKHKHKWTHLNSKNPVPPTAADRVNLAPLPPLPPPVAAPVARCKTKPTRFQCPDCASDFASAQAVRKHQVTAHSREELAKVVCDHCGGKFYDQSALQSHLASLAGASRKRQRAGAGGGVDEDDVPVKHKGGRKPSGVKKTYTCALPECNCGEVFHHKHAWERHESAVTKMRKYPCSMCKQLFSNTSDRGKHQKSFCKMRPGAGIGNFPCDMCDATFTTEVALKAHKRRPVHNPDAKKHKCDYPECDYVAIQPNLLAIHKQRHSDARPFVCVVDTCDKAFKTRDDLYHHADSHKETADNSCELCDSAFTTVRLLAMHTRNVHGAHRFACPDCDKKFRVKVARDQHLLTHGDARTYACTTCGLTFRQKQVMENHVVYMHTLSRVYTCDFCKLEFSSPARLATHAVVHTADTRGWSTSAGETAIADLLDAAGIKHARELTPTGHRFRFDFATYPLDARALQSPVALVEYDGMWHYQPRGKTSDHTYAFMKHVQRDLNKTRFARSKGIPLLRYSGTAYRAIVADLNAAVSGSEKELVMPRAFKSDLARCCSLPVEPLLVDDAVVLVAASLPWTTGGLTPDDLMSVQEAIAILFAREFVDYTPADIIHTVGKETLDAFIFLAKSIPEFAQVRDEDDDAENPDDDAENEGSQVSNDDDAEDDDDAKDDTAKVSEDDTDATGVPRVANIHVPGARMVTCWFCPAPFQNNQRTADVFMKHVNKIHGGRWRIQCAWCPSVFDCHTERLRRVHDDACTGRGPAVKSREWAARARCAICSEDFRARHRLLRHMNETHDAKFPADYLLMCNACGWCGARCLIDLAKHHETCSRK